MFQPDFEAIRKKAISDMLNNMAFKSSNDRKMAEVLAQSASIVAANMLAAYHKKLMEHLQKDQGER